MWHSYGTIGTEQCLCSNTTHLLKGQEQTMTHIFLTQYELHAAGLQPMRMRKQKRMTSVLSFKPINFHDSNDDKNDLKICDDKNDLARK